jgi:hypothetical protein
VTPKLDHLLLSVVEVFLSLEEALENLRDIAHVELVMTESRCRQEGLTHSIENIDGSISQGLYQLLDLLVEAREFVFTDSLVNLLHNLFSGEREVKHVEARDYSGSDLLTTTTWFSHSSDYFQILNHIRLLSLAVIPEAVV